MSQQSVLQLLERSKKPLTSQEIAKKLKLSSVSNSISKLMKYNEIKSVWLNVKRNSSYEHIKALPRLHYFV